MTRWNDTNTPPNWTANTKELIGTPAGWTRRQVLLRNNGSVHKIRNETLVSIANFLSKKTVPRPVQIFFSNGSGGSILRRNHLCIANIVWDEQVKLKATNARLRISIANTAGGNSMIAVTSNNFAAGANNVMRFRWVPNTAGVYKIQAQTIAKSNTAATWSANLHSIATTPRTANLVIGSSVSNTYGIVSVV